MRPAKRDIEGDLDTQRLVLSMRARISIGGLCFFLFIGLLAYTNAPHFAQALQGLGQDEALNDGGNVSGPELVWSRTYGEHRIDRVTGIARHQDGGYVVAQTRFNYDPLDVNIYEVMNGGGGMILLTKIDSTGNKIWEKDYGDDDKAYHTASIVESADGGFMVVAAVKLYGLPSNGTVIGRRWMRELELNRNMPTSERTPIKADLLSSILSAHLFKIDGDGHVVWEKTYMDMDIPLSLVSDGDGGYLLSGQEMLGWEDEVLSVELLQGRGYGANTYRVKVIGINENGDKTWEGNYWWGMGPIIGTGDGRFVAISEERSGRWSIFRGRTKYPGILNQVRQLPSRAGDAEGWDMVPSGDGGFFVSYTHDDYGNPAGITRFDEAFNIVWNRTVSPNFGHKRSYLVGSGDGGCVSAFTRGVEWGDLGNNEVYVCKFDEEGNTVWNRTHDDQVRAPPGLKLSSYAVRWDGLGGLIRSGDGGFVLAGSVLGDLRMLKIDAEGDLVWDRTHGSRDVPLDIVESGDGGYVVAGFTQRGSRGRDAYLARTDADGEMVWEAWYGGPTADSFQGVVPSNDGGFVATGHSSSLEGDRDVYVLKIDGEGHKVWEKTYGTPEQDWAEDIAPTRDGGFLVVGNTVSCVYDSSYVYVLKIDERGEKVWERNYAYQEQEYAHGVAATGDGYIIVGETISGKVTSNLPWIGGTYRVPNPWALKIDDRGGVVWEKPYECDDPAWPASGCFAADIVGSNEQGFAITTHEGYIDPMCGMLVGSRTFRINEYGEKIWETPPPQ